MRSKREREREAERIQQERLRQRAIINSTTEKRRTLAIKNHLFEPKGELEEGQEQQAF